MITYSRTWFELFLKGVPPEQTKDEVAFLTRNLPLADHSRVLDLCCGMGRHAVPLARQGYAVTGVDLDVELLAEARLRAPAGTSLVAADMRDLGAVAGPFDGIVSMWQSFGYFDEATNQTVLRSLIRLLRPGGRLVFDLYNRGFFRRPSGARQIALGGAYALERWQMAKGRMTVRVDFGNGAGFDVFNWQLYSADELTALLHGMGMRPVLACAEFDESVAVSPKSVRMQLVFERT